MIINNQSACPRCGGRLKRYDRVKRIVRTKYGKKKELTLRRFRCITCRSVHRELPTTIFPHKQYEAEIITDVLKGIITCETPGFEDHPCEMTMIRWRLFPPTLFLLSAFFDLK